MTCKMVIKVIEGVEFKYGLEVKENRQPIKKDAAQKISTQLLTRAPGSNIFSTKTIWCSGHRGPSRSEAGGLLHDIFVIGREGIFDIAGC